MIRFLHKVGAVASARGFVSALSAPGWRPASVQAVACFGKVPFRSITQKAHSMATSEEETIDVDDGWIVQPDNPDSPKLFRIVSPSPKCPAAKYLVSWLNPHDTHKFLEEAVIGWYLDHPHLDDDGAVVLDPLKFVENDLFKNFLHSKIQECLESRQEPNLDFSATGTLAGTLFITPDLFWREINDSIRIIGWTNVVDVAPWRVGAGVDPIHMLGSIKVDETGKIESGTYTPNPVHRLLTPNGLFRLPNEIQSCLLSDLEVDVLRSCSATASAVAAENQTESRIESITEEQKKRLADRAQHPKEEDFSDDSPNQAAGVSGHSAPGASSQTLVPP
jgi:hypothetical protein